MAHHRGSVLRYLGEEVQEEEGVVKWMVYECMKTPTSAHCAAFTESYHSDYRPFLNQVRIPTRLFWARSVSEYSLRPTMYIMHIVL